MSNAEQTPSNNVVPDLSDPSTWPVPPLSPPQEKDIDVVTLTEIENTANNSPT